MPIFTVSKGFLPLVTRLNNQIAIRKEITIHELLKLHSTSQESMIFKNIKDAKTMLIAMLQSPYENNNINIFDSPVIFKFKDHGLDDIPEKKLTAEIITDHIISNHTESPQNYDFTELCIKEDKLRAAQELNNNFAMPFFKSAVISSTPEMAWYYDHNISLKKLQLRRLTARPMSW